MDKNDLAEKARLVREQGLCSSCIERGTRVKGDYLCKACALMLCAFCAGKHKRGEHKVTVQK